MRFCSLASGSSGNCQYIETREKRVLVDAGLSGVKIEKALESIGIAPESLDAIFVTHEHNDHSKGVGVLARRYQLDVFGNRPTLEAMTSLLKGVDEGRIHVIIPGMTITYGDLYIHPFSTFHDCRDGVAYLFGSMGKKLAHMTDTGWVSPEMKGLLRGSDFFYIEANHDEEMLLQGPYSFSLKQRILSNRGHLSNRACARILGEVLGKEGQHILLAHLSHDNNIPLLAVRTVREFLEEKGFFEGVHVHLDVARRHEPSRIYTL